MCIGLVIFAGFTYFQNGGFEVTTDQNDIFIYCIPVFGMLGYFGSKWVYQNLLQNIPKEEALPKKLERYQKANIIKYALVEGPAFLALVLYYIDGKALYLVIGLSLLTYLLFQRPSLDKLKRELPMYLEEEKEFDTLN